MTPTPTPEQALIIQAARQWRNARITATDHTTVKTFEILGKAEADLAEAVRKYENANPDC